MAAEIAMKVIVQIGFRRWPLKFSVENRILNYYFIKKWRFKVLVYILFKVHVKMVVRIAFKMAVQITCKEWQLKLLVKMSVSVACKIGSSYYQ